MVTQAFGTKKTPLAEKSFVFSYLAETWQKLTFLCTSGWPKLLWFVTESKHLSKPPRDWFPHIKDANNDTAYIEVS